MDFARFSRFPVLDRALAATLDLTMRPSVFSPWGARYQESHTKFCHTFFAFESPMTVTLSRAVHLVSFLGVCLLTLVLN